MSLKNFFTLSFHGEKNYPFKKEKSDLDIGFPGKTDDSFYLKKLEHILVIMFLVQILKIMKLEKKYL